MSDDSKPADAKAKPARQWPITITLKTPVSLGGPAITELVFQRPKLGMLRGVGNSAGYVDMATMKFDTLIAIGAKMCNQPTQVLDQVDVADAGEVLDVITDFVAASLQTGGTR